MTSENPLINQSYPNPIRTHPTRRSSNRQKTSQLQSHFSNDQHPVATQSTTQNHASPSSSPLNSDSNQLNLNTNPLRRRIIFNLFIHSSPGRKLNEQEMHAFNSCIALTYYGTQRHRRIILHDTYRITTLTTVTRRQQARNQC